MTQASQSIAQPTAVVTDSLHPRIYTYVALFIVLAVSYPLLRGSDWLGSTELHTLMETVATLLAAFVGVMALARFYSKKSSTFLFIGAGFLGTALLDGYHAGVTSSFFNDLWPSAPSSLIPWSWIASRLFLSLLIFFSWWAWTREERLGDAGRLSERTVYALVGAWTVVSFAFFALMPLPRAYYPELLFHRPEEFVPALFFGLALVGYLRKGLWKTDSFEHWLVLSLIVGFMGQAMFMSFSGQIFDFEFDSAHALKKLSYVFVLVGLLISMLDLFKQAEHGKMALSAKADELSETNKELEDFTYVVSHDLKEPLRGIEAFSSFLAEDYSEKLDDEGKRYISVVRESAVRMKVLIEDLLELSRIGRVGAKYTNVAMEPLIAEVANELQFSIEEKHVNLRIAPDLPDIICDRTRIKEVFANLISNAIKFSDKSEPLVEIACRRNGGGHTFSVADDGIGIAEEYHEKVFGIFQRLNHREDYEGTGAGLTICKKIVEAHGGEIRVESEVGHGATFFFTIPTNLSPAQEDKEQSVER